MTPIFASKLPLLRKYNTPIDFGKTYNGHPVFGKNKTWRGLISGILAGTLVGWLIHDLFFAEDPLAHYLIVSAAMSAGALIGDAVESFFKRQRGIKSGQAWFPFDQTDYIVGGLVFVLPFGIPSLEIIMWVLSLYFGLHLLSAYIGYKLGLKDQPI